MVVVLRCGFALVGDSLCSWLEAVSHPPLLVKMYRLPSCLKSLTDLAEASDVDVGTEVLIN